MRRFLCIVPLLIAAVWMAAGASTGLAHASVLAGSSDAGSNELRPRLKAVQLVVATCKHTRPASQASAEPQPRVQLLRFVPPPCMARTSVVVLQPRPSWSLPAAPSLTGRVVILV